MTTGVKLQAYADDMKLYCAYERANCVEARSALQVSIENMYKWASNCGIPLNLDKCAVMHIGSTDTPRTLLMGPV